MTTKAIKRPQLYQILHTFQTKKPKKLDDFYKKAHFLMKILASRG